MSKKVKSLIERDLAGKLKGLDGLAVINPRGIDANKNNSIRRKLHAQGLRMTVVRNTLAKRAGEGETKIKGFEQLLEGPSAVVYGKAGISTIARLLLEERKLDEKIELRGIVFDGDIFLGLDGVTDVSKLPTREEAVSQILAAMLGPGASLAAALGGPGSTLGSLIKAIEEKAEKAGGAEAPATEAAAQAEAPPQGEASAPAPAAG